MKKQKRVRVREGVGIRAYSKWLLFKNKVAKDTQIFRKSQDKNLISKQDLNHSNQNFAGLHQADFLFIFHHQTMHTTSWTGLYF